ncbi:phospholipid transporting ATPase [Rhodotorula kratochvilovae]
MFRRQRDPQRRESAYIEQFDPDTGRNLSDSTHPDYDPATDPELRLRVTRTAAESIHELYEEEDRRRFKRLASRRTKKDAGGSTLKPRRTLFGRKKPRASTDAPDSQDGHGTESAAGAHELDESQRAELERQMTRLAAAKEAEESARRQDKQDENEQEKKKKDRRRRGVKEKERRNVYVNVEGIMTDPRGYERNKVRTSKYTLLSFVPKNLTEQFRRIANIYFLALVVLQVFPIFGAASPEIGMLPLVAILCITGIKDGIEDTRRHKLDNEVNNSAVTRLGDWKNVNVPDDDRPWWAFWRRPNPNHRVSKGVRKLRAKEGSYDAGFLYADQPFAAASRDTLGGESIAIAGPRARGDSAASTLPGGGLAKSESSHSVESYATSYPPRLLRSAGGYDAGGERAESLAQSTGRKSTSDVVSYEHATPGTAKWERTLWKKLEVGDVVLLKENDQIPADVVVLATSDADGVCFVETKNLDGETNLKPRKSLKATMGIGNEEDIEHARFWVDSEPPHANLYSYNGVLRWRGKADKLGMEHPIVEGRERDDGEEMQEPITINELLLRGCALRNTKWVIGLVVFTGADTKIMLNQGETPSKRSKIEKETNFNVLANFAVLIALCVGCAIGAGVYDGMSGRSAQYYEPGAEYSSSAVVVGFITFGATLILFQNIVPISLVITVELVKTIQAFFIYQDIDMYYEPLDHPCVPKTWNISDDLGQIEYIFSDKTGTLTQNVMEFQKCAVGGISYGEGITEAMLGAAKREGRDTSAFDPAQNVDRLTERKQQMIDTFRAGFKNRYLREDQLTLISPPMADALLERGTEQQQRLVDFWRSLAICHTVLTERIDESNPDILEYKAESPDEAALVAAARDAGFVFLHRSNQEITLDVMGQPERYVPLRTLAFNSARKRMSTLVRTPDNRVLLICKGADSVILQRLCDDHDKGIIERTTKQLEDFANAGLRTLLISSRYLTDEEFTTWSKTYDKACAAIEDREDEIERACELVEHDLTILGATALEDKLQAGVPEAIAQLHKAGIKLWILTGDKLQTAIEIGFSCNLLTNDMEILILSAESEEGARAQIEAALDKVNRARAGLAPLDTDAGEKIPGATKSDGFAVVIDGETLRYALDLALKPMFLELTTQCNAVVCCRVSPSQKALTVKLVKEGKNAMTLAIGDGANDVAMIQEAHIGVGIAGLEGAQASMSADYAVGQFRYLNKLLLVHGRWCYIRVADMHANFFYKNIVWTLTLFLYQIFCNFDSTYLYEYTLIMLFNLVFTSLPVAILGIADQDLNAETSLRYPQLYRRGILGKEWTRTKFFIYMLDGLYQSAVAFFIPLLVYWFSPTLSVTGHDWSIWELGTTVAACAVTAANLYVGLNTRYWTWIVFVVIIASTLAFHVWIAIYSQFQTFFFDNELIYLYGTLNFWTSIVLVQVIAIGPRYLWKYIQSAYYPLDSDIVREMQVLRQKGKASGFDLEGGGGASIVPFATSTHQHDAALETREHLPLVQPHDPRDPRQRHFSHETASEEPITPRADLAVAPWPPSSPAGDPLSPIPSPYGPSSYSSSPLYASAHSTPFDSPSYAPSPGSGAATPIGVPHILVNDATPRESFTSRYSAAPPSSHAANDSLEFDVLDYANHRESQWGAPGGGAFTEETLNARSPLEAAHRQWRSEASSTGADSFHSAVESSEPPSSPAHGGHQQQPSYSSGTGYAL